MEIDIWGKYRRNAEAAKAALQGAHAGYELALVTLSADVAQQYFSYRMTEKQLEIARRNSLAQKESVRLTEAMFRLGASSGRDYDQAVAMQKNTEADIPQLEAQLITSRNALCVLLGSPGPVPELARTGCRSRLKRLPEQRGRLPGPQRGKRFLKGQCHTRRNAPPSPLSLWT